MKKIDIGSLEVVSFNSAVPAVAALIELDESALDLVSGGRLSTEICVADDCVQYDGTCVVNYCKRDIEV